MNHIDFRMREIVEYGDHLTATSQCFLQKAKHLVEAKQQLSQSVFAWESSMQCVLLEDGIFFTQVPSLPPPVSHPFLQTGRRPLHLSSLLVSSIQIDTEILLPCFERYHQHIFTLQLALKRWKDRKTKLLSAIKHFQAKKQEKFNNESALVESTSSRKSCSSIFDRWFQQKGSPTRTPVDVQSEEEAHPVSPTPISLEEVEEDVKIPSGDANCEESTDPPLVGNITSDDPISNSDSEKLLPTPTQPIDLEISHWGEVVRDLREEYQHLSEQTLNEFHPFMEKKRLLVLESLFQYATRQVFFPSLCPSLLFTLDVVVDLSRISSSLGGYNEFSS